LLEGKPEPLVKLYLVLEKTLKGLGGVEIVAHERYALFRTTRVFADLVFMSDALRLAILLDREVKDPLFFKIGRMSRHRVGHVTKLRSSAELRAVTPYLKEAYRFAQSEQHRTGKRS
jgi:predicted transport protein